MTKPPEFDEQDAHRYFSIECFNLAWDLIEKADRSPAEDDEMVRLSLASAWHWSRRADCTAKNLSISHWQASRIFAMLGQAQIARHYGLLCLEASQSEDVPPFYLAYAYEALARAEAIAGDQEKVAAHLAEARRVGEHILKAEDRQQLQDDLATIRI